MDSFYSYPIEQVEKVRNEKAWMKDPKYFKRVFLSPSATIKMLTHGQQGVEKGIHNAGKPIEVMGLLMGRPGVEDPHSLVITDAFPLPIEGFETRVVADDNNVMNYMIELGDVLESSRHERFCGWYHTHPFDLDGTSHCFLSNTDVTTQLQWQRSEDPHGNPWLAVVLDPLLSLSQGRPELMAFRVFPPDFAPPENMTPDHKIVRDDRTRVEKWGACWNRYYLLDTHPYVSTLTRATLSTLQNKFLWHLPLCTAGNSSEKDRDVVQALRGMNRIFVKNQPFRRHRGQKAVDVGEGAWEGLVDSGDAESGASFDVLTGGRDKGMKHAAALAGQVQNHFGCVGCAQLTQLAVFASSRRSAGAPAPDSAMEV